MTQTMKLLSNDVTSLMMKWRHHLSETCVSVNIDLFFGKQNAASLLGVLRDLVWLQHFLCLKQNLQILYVSKKNLATDQFTVMCATRSDLFFSSLWRTVKIVSKFTSFYRFESIVLSLQTSKLIVFSFYRFIVLSFHRFIVFW